MTLPPFALLVEDEPLIRMTMEEVLLSAEVDFVSVGTGDEAIKELRKDPSRFQIVISDIRMPGSADGWSVGRIARELSANISVLYVTGDSGVHWATKGVSSSALLQKPFSDEQLIDAVNRLTNSH